MTAPPVVPSPPPPTMTPTGKDTHTIARPPKKRPLALFNYTLDTPAGADEDDNMQPQDLSMKTRRRLEESAPPLPRPPAPTPPPPPRPCTPRRPADVSALLDLVGGSINISANITNTNITNTSIVNTSIANTPVSSNSVRASPGLGHPVSISGHSSSLGSSVSVSSSNGHCSSSGYSSNFSNSNSSFMSSAGLRLISEVAAACGRPTVLRTPGGNPSPHSVPYAPPTPRDPLRHVMRDRGSHAWHYHPYLPLGVYGLPSPLAPAHAPPPASSPASRPRGGSVSPPGEAGSSSSESSPEAQGEARGARLACPDCGRRYATVAGLAKHRQFHCLKDAGRSFACKHCDKVYTSLGALKMHIRTHTLPCKCQLCGKAFSRPWLLQGHIRTHTGEKPFQCNQCERCFADRSNLRAHLQTHTDVKKYACRTCPKTFSRMSLLVKHEDHGCPGARPSRPLILAPAPPLPL